MGTETQPKGRKRRPKRRPKPPPVVWASCLRCRRRQRVTLQWPVVLRLRDLPDPTVLLDVDCAADGCRGRARVMAGDLSRAEWWRNGTARARLR